MRNAKLWSALLAAVLLCVCIAGVLFTGISAETVAVPYEVDGVAYTSVREALAAAKDRTWAENEVLEITLSIADASADVTEPEEGESSNLLFGQTTIFNTKGDKVPVVIKGDGEASIAAPQKKVACANDYTFRDLSYNIGASSCILYAGSGNVVFERVSFSSASGRFYADNFTLDAFAGWDELAEGEFVETSITFGEGIAYLHSTSNKQPISAVGYNPACDFKAAPTSNPYLSNGTVNYSKVDAVLEEAKTITFEAATNGLQCPDIRPINTKTTFTVDNLNCDTKEIAKGYVRVGCSPVASSTMVYKRAYTNGMAADYHSNENYETYVGDIKMVLDGCKLEDGGTYFRGLNSSILIGNFTVEVKDSDPNDKFETSAQIFQGGQNTPLLIGNYEFIMSAGTLGTGQGGTIDGYYGAPATTGSIVNRISGGNIWQFSGVRYAPLGENTPVEVSDGTAEGKIKKNVSIHNIITGGTFGGTKGKEDNITNVNGFFGAAGSNSSSALTVPSVCNEISGGTFYNYCGGVNTVSSGKVNEVINVVTGTPTFIKTFYGTSKAITYKSTLYQPKEVKNVTNYILGGEFQDGVYCAFRHASDSITNVFDGAVTVAGSAVAASDYDSSAEASMGNKIGSVKTIVRGGTINKFFGPYYTNVTGDVINQFTGGTFRSVYGAYYGSIGGKLSNEFSGGTFGVYEIYDPATYGEYSSFSGKVVTGGTAKPASGNVTLSDSRTFTYGAYYVDVTGNIENTICGDAVIVAYRGAYEGSAATVKNTVENTGEKIPVIGPENLLTTSETSNFVGCYATNTDLVQNYYKGGKLTYVRGTNSSNSDLTKTKEIYNEIDGATIYRNFTGVHATVFDEAKCVVKSGTLSSTVYMIYARTKATGKVINEISGGRFVGNADILLGGYGGKLIASVENTISGSPEFDSPLYCGSGSKVWPSRVGSVTTTIKGGTYNKKVYGGGLSCYVVGDVKLNLEAGTFNAAVYGGSYGAFKEASNTADSSFYNKSVEGTIRLTVGETGKAGPTFNANLLAADYGDGSFRAKHEIKLVTTFYSGTMVKNFYGGTETKNAPISSIENNVYGGHFKGRFTAGCYGGAISGNVTNNITGGTFDGYFYGGSYNSAAISGKITNNFNGGTFNNLVYGGSNGSSQTTGSIENYVKDGFVSTASYNGGCDAGTVTGSVKNVITGGIFSGNGMPIGNPEPTYFSAYFGGRSVVNGGIVNEISGGEFSYYVIGGTNGKVVSNTTENAPIIVNSITGGTFRGFWGANSANAVLEGEIVNNVSGGNFLGLRLDGETYSACFAGGNRNKGNEKLAITNNISGGFFEFDFAAGDFATNANYKSEVAATAPLVTNITGGIFGNIYSNSRFTDETIKYLNATLTITQTDDVVLKLFGICEADSFTANGEAVEIGANTNITVAALNGTLNVTQTEGWLAHDYLKLPAGSAYTVTEAEDVYGAYLADDTILVKGVAVIPVGATIRLAERLGVRVVLNKEDVDAYGDVFTYVVTQGNQIIASGGYAEIVANDYSILFDGIGLSEFDDEFTVSSPLFYDINESIVTLAQKAQVAWAGNAKWKAYADAIIEFNAVFNGDEENTMLPAEVTTVPSAAKGNADGIVAADVTLLMADAAGLKLNVTLNEAPVNAKILVNGKEVNAQLVTVSENTITAELYFAHEYLADVFVISVQTDAGEHMTYTVSIEALAHQLMVQEGNDYADNAKAFLVYIQKAVACK